MTTYKYLILFGKQENKCPRIFKLVNILKLVNNPELWIVNSDQKDLN